MSSRKEINILKAKQILLLHSLRLGQTMQCLSGIPGPCRWKALRWAQRSHGKGTGAHRKEEFSVRSPGTREAVTSSNWSCLCRTNTALDTAGEGEGSSLWKEIHCFQMRYSAKIFFFFPGEEEKTSCNDSECSQAFCQTQPLPSSSWTAPISANW